MLKDLLRLAPGAIASLCPFVLAATASAQVFPPRGDDVMPSLGSFRIMIQPAFRPLFAGYPGYDGVSRLDSPTMHDPTTVVGRSDPHPHGSPPDLTGTPVGTAGTMIKDSDLTVLPTGFQGPVGTTEVHTQVVTFNLADLGGSGARVRAGTMAPLQPISPGEVESQNTGGTGLPPDFPADSFFDIFVEVDLPALGGLTAPATLFNRIPLLVVNSPLLRFPPRVVYIHGNSTAVPIYFRNANPPQWNAGDCLGWLILAGHGAGFTNSSTDIQQFHQIMRNQQESRVVTELVSPITTAAAEGDSNNAFPWNSTVPRRYTQIHSDLGGPRSVTMLSFRGNAGNTINYNGVRNCDMEMLMADSVDWDQASFVFAANYAGPTTSVFARRVINLGPLGVNSLTGPLPFTIFVPLDAPYSYTGVRSLMWEALVHANPVVGTFNQVDAESGGTTSGVSTITGTGCIATGRTTAMTHIFSATDRSGLLVLIPSVTNGPSNAYSVLTLGTTNPNLPFPGLCANLFTDLVAMVDIGTTTATGALTTDNGLAFIMPNLYGGATLTSQVASLDIGRPPTQLPLSLSNGRSVVLPMPNLTDVVKVTRIYNINGGPTGTLAVPITSAHSYGIVTEFR